MSDWPVENNKPVPAATMWFRLLNAMRKKLRAEGRDADDITDVAWALRELEMDRRQRRRDAFVRRYRPILTLQGDRLKYVHDFIMKHGREPTWID